MKQGYGYTYRCCEQIGVPVHRRSPPIDIARFEETSATVECRRQADSEIKQSYGYTGCVESLSYIRARKQAVGLVHRCSPPIEVADFEIHGHADNEVKQSCGYASCVGLLLYTGAVNKKGCSGTPMLPTDQSCKILKHMCNCGMSATGRHRDQRSPCD